MTDAALVRGEFVEVVGQNDGIGKVVEVDGNHVDVDYFVSPAGPRLERRRARVEEVRPVELAPQTRVYWLDEQHAAWRAGRVDGGLIDGAALGAREAHYHVRFPNDLEARIPQSRLYVRWAHPIDDPTDYLAARITDTPFFFDGRAQIVRYFAGERAAFGGLAGLASSAIDLLEHQVTIVRRVLADPIERYLLADEVGLGKTVEAGALIRQHVIEQPRAARVLVVVPPHLVEQWRRELAEKCFLDHRAPVTVVSEDQLLASAIAPGGLSMLVVDEAHRATLRAFHADAYERRLYDRLRAFAASVPRVLLLSGTPVLHQEDGFLAMLHLLDPDGYPLEDRDRFRRRVRDRQAVAEAVADLPDDSKASFAEDAISSLEKLFPDDQRLADLCVAARNRLYDDVDAPERARTLRALRHHLTETYRLHRRMLRTRRDDPRVADQLPRRTGVERVDYEDDARAEAFDFVEAWRQAALPAPGAHVDERAARLMTLWVESALSDPRVLVRRIDERLALATQQSRSASPAAARWFFVEEPALLSERRTLILGAITTEARTRKLADWLRTTLETRKAVVFVDDTEVADHVAASLAEVIGLAAVLRFREGGDDERAFHSDASTRVLVCDARAEEGLNLQRAGAVLVHYDLPLAPSRIEQRIGRVDRIEARGRLRNVVLAATCAYEREWTACLIDAIGVFRRSVAPLQYVLLDTTARIRAALALEGREAITAAAVRMSDPRDGLDVELKRIRAQEALDSLEVDPDRDHAFFEALVDADQNAADKGAEDFDSWAVRRLQFERRQHETDGQRYVYCLATEHAKRSPARRPTLLPLQDALSRFGACIDRNPETQRRPDELPFQPVTFDREVAEERQIGLLRLGHPFIEAMQALVRADDRGAAFAMWRYVPGRAGLPATLFFRFDFVIEADLAPAGAVARDLDAPVETLRRRADEAFPVSYRTIWLDSDLVEVGDAETLSLLEMPYARRDRFDGSGDTNIRLERWDAVDAAVRVTDWGDFSARARRKAEQLVRDDFAFQSRCQSLAGLVRDHAAANDDALRSRVARLAGAAGQAEARAADFELRLGAAIADGIVAPSIRVDSAGAVYLAGERLRGAP